MRWYGILYPLYTLNRCDTVSWYQIPSQRWSQEGPTRRTLSALKCCRHQTQTITLYPLWTSLECLDQDGEYGMWYEILPTGNPRMHGVVPHMGLSYPLQRYLLGDPLLDPKGPFEHGS